MAKKEKKQKPKKKLNLLKPIILAIVIIATILGLVWYLGGYSTQKSHADNACKENKTCIFNSQCGIGAYCQKKGIFSDLILGKCVCKKIKEKPSQKCATLPVPPPPQGCKYKVDEQNPCWAPPLYCDDGRVCQSDEICGEGKTCYQPPMPKCSTGKACLQVMPQKICVTTTVPNKSCQPYPAPSGCTWKPSLIKRKTTNLNSCDPPPMLFCDEGRNCEKDRICGAGKYCFENPAPLMPDCKDCPKITSTKPRWICKKTDKTSTGSAGSGTIQITGATKKTIE